MADTHIGNVTVGDGHPLGIIAGPCVIETLDQCLEIGAAVRDRCHELGFGYVFKASFDKANRSSIHSDRGPGLAEGLRILAAVAKELGVPIATDIHESHQAAELGGIVDLLQIPAFLCRQTDLLVAAAQTGKAVNVKKGQFLSPAEMENVAIKINEAFDEHFPQTERKANLMLTERGTFFGYNRLVTDFIGLGDLMDLGYPVCFDVTHSTQQPGGQGTQSGGRPDRAPLLAKAAVVAGVHALFIETHPDPPNAASDAAVVLPIETTRDLLADVARLRDAL